MTRALLPGTWLNEIAGSTERWPAWRVLVWNPRQITINELASGQFKVAPIDLSDYVETLQYEENVGFENSDNPTTTRCSFRFRRNRLGLDDLRRGLIDDGVLVRVYSGDRRVRMEDWVCIFTGTFRGRAADDPGTPSQLTEFMEAAAYGREERFLNLTATTDKFGKDTDVGQIALAIATEIMGLGQDEVLIGAQGFKSQHVSNQVVDTNCLDALYQLLFVVGKKPKFDSLGRLCAVEVDLDKPAARILSAGDHTVEQITAQPNDVEVNNSVLLHGLSSVMTKAASASQLLVTLDAVTGFFDSEFKKQVYYSQDHSQRAQNTFLTTKKKIWFSDAKWTPEDEFHGLLDIDTHYLSLAREIIFAVYLASELAIAAIDYYFQAAGSGATGVIVQVVTFGAATATLASERLALKIISQVALAALLWAMQFIGSGTYEIWGEPFEYVYQELQSRALLPGLDPDEIRQADFRNDFLSTMDELDVRVRELLRRELVKDQLFQITMMDDPLLEVDDVLETSSGERFYVLNVRKNFQREKKATMTLTCWKIFDPVAALVEEVA